MNLSRSRSNHRRRRRLCLSLTVVNMDAASALLQLRSDLRSDVELLRSLESQCSPSSSSSPLVRRLLKSSFSKLTLIDSVLFGPTACSPPSSGSLQWKFDTLLSVQRHLQSAYDTRLAASVGDSTSDALRLALDVVEEDRRRADKAVREVEREIRDRVAESRSQDDCLEADADALAGTTPPTGGPSSSSSSSPRTLPLVSSAVPPIENLPLLSSDDSSCSDGALTLSLIEPFAQGAWGGGMGGAAGAVRRDDRADVRGDRREVDYDVEAVRRCLVRGDEDVKNEKEEDEEDELVEASIEGASESYEPASQPLFSADLFLSPAGADIRTPEKVRPVSCASLPPSSSLASSAEPPLSARLLNRILSPRTPVPPAPSATTSSSSPPPSSPPSAPPSPIYRAVLPPPSSTGLENELLLDASYDDDDASVHDVDIGPDADADACDLTLLEAEGRRGLGAADPANPAAGSGLSGVSAAKPPGRGGPGGGGEIEDFLSPKAELRNLRPLPSSLLRAGAKGTTPEARGGLHPSSSLVGGGGVSSSSNNNNSNSKPPLSPFRPPRGGAPPASTPPPSSSDAPSSLPRPPRSPAAPPLVSAEKCGESPPPSSSSSSSSSRRPSPSPVPGFSSPSGGKGGAVGGSGGGGGKDRGAKALPRPKSAAVVRSLEDDFVGARERRSKNDEGGKRVSPDKAGSRGLL